MNQGKKQRIVQTASVMNGRRPGGSRLWPLGSNEIRWCNAGCPSLPACLERNPPACRPWPDAQPDAVWADSASGTGHSPMAIFPASHQRIRWLSAGGWGRKNWRVFGGPPMYAIWAGSGSRDTTSCRCVFPLTNTHLPGTILNACRLRALSCRSQC